MIFIFVYLAILVVKAKRLRPLVITPAASTKNNLSPYLCRFVMGRPTPAIVLNEFSKPRNQHQDPNCPKQEADAKHRDKVEEACTNRVVHCMGKEKNASLHATPQTVDQDNLTQTESSTQPQYSQSQCTRVGS